MTEAAWLFLGTALTVLAGAVATAYRSRRASPDSQATLIGASDLLLTQMQNRLAQLEIRVSMLERENDAYHRLYGPLPTTTPGGTST